MKSRFVIFGFLALTSALVIGSAYADSTSAFQSPLSPPTFVSPLNPSVSVTNTPQTPIIPGVNAPYVTRDLVVTQEAEYASEIAATRTALAATLARTDAYSLTLTPNPSPSLFPMPTVTPTANP